MGKRGLYPTLSTKKSNEQVNLMMNLISFCDGSSSLLDIAEILGAPVWDLYDLIDTLVSHNLLEVSE